MKNNILFLAFTAMALSVSAQTTIPNGDFENWGGNPSPGVSAEPTGWYSNKSGSTIAQMGPQTAYNETTSPHSGTSCLRLETKNYLTTPVNGSLTTGVINAPSFTKSEGYIGTVNYSSASDIRRLAFVGRPDSLVGWYKYTKATSGSDAATETGKVEMFLHTDQYNAPENANGGNTSANRIATALFVTPSQNQTTWKRFSVPFVYVNGTTPEFAMINMTSSSNQTTNASGSKLWLDDLEVVYNPTSTICDAPSGLVLTQNATSIDFSWTAAATVPADGYGYAVIAADSAQSPIPFVATTNTSVTGIAATTVQFSENLIVGRTYNAYVIALCDQATSDVSSMLTQTFTFGSGVGVKENQFENFSVYTHERTIIVDLSEQAETNTFLRIVDLTGKEVMQVKLNANEKNSILIPASMQTGTYFYTVWGNKIQKTGKIAL